MIISLCIKITLWCLAWKSVFEFCFSLSLITNQWSCSPGLQPTQTPFCGCHLNNHNCCRHSRCCLPRFHSRTSATFSHTPSFWNPVYIVITTYHHTKIGTIINTIIFASNTIIIFAAVVSRLNSTTLNIEIYTRRKREKWRIRNKMADAK